MSTDKQLTTISDDGYEDVGATDKIIQGDIDKCVDGFWSHRDGTLIPPGTKKLALATTSCLQHWQDQTPIETIIKQPGVPLPDVDELNSRIPEKEWEEGLNGEPRPPWTKQWVVYLLDPIDASISTFINSTTGARIAVEKLQERVKWMRALRGDKVVPVVELNCKPMKTKFGVKQRPEFVVVEWRDLSALAAPAQATPALGKPVTEPSLKEEMADEMPPWDKQGDKLPDLAERKFSDAVAPKKK